MENIIRTDKKSIHMNINSKLAKYV